LHGPPILERTRAVLINTSYNNQSEYDAVGARFFHLKSRIVDDPGGFFFYFSFPARAKSLRSLCCVLPFYLLVYLRLSSADTSVGTPSWV